MPEQLGQMHRLMIERALSKYGSVRSIATNCGVAQPKLNDSINAGKLTPQQAYAIARDLGMNREMALVEAMMRSARSPTEREFWGDALTKLMGEK